MNSRITHSNRIVQPSAASATPRSTVSPKPSAYRTPRAEPSASDAEVERLGQQVVELLERVRQGDERGVYLEQQLQHMTHMANAAAAAATALPQPLAIPDDALKAKPNNAWIAWTAFGLLGALMIAAYVFGYVPLRSQFEELSKQNVLQASQSAAALDKLKNSFSEERQALQSQLSAAQAAASAAQQPAAAEPPSSRSSRSSSASDSDTDDDSSEHTRLTKEDREAKKAERAAKAEERKAAYEAKKAERLAKREERKAAAEERRAAKAESSSSSSSRKHASDDADEPAPSKPAKPSRSSDSGDDPLQGLDGL